MSHADFLVELGTEELPPKALLNLRDAFAQGLVKGLADARLGHGEISSYATPRRLAVLVRELATQQPTQEIENRGPPVRLAFDKDGLPTKAAAAFAAKCGVTVEDLSTVASDKGEWLFFSGTAPGAPTHELAGPLVTQALAGLPIPKRMRWGSSEAEFVRPVHWLLMLLGDTVVDAEVLGLRAGRVTYGHRFHRPGSITLETPAAYAEVLRNDGMVIASFEVRRELVIAAAQKAAAGLGGEPVLEADVVDEVTALVEWPVPVAGRFDAAFLRLPPEVLTSTLQDHQRYFPVVSAGELLAAFVATSNIESKQPDEVRRGNERVVLPRLADAAFFWDQDSKRALAGRVDDLRDVVYQKGLGSLHDKSERVAQLAAGLARMVNAKPKEVARAAKLARTDLLTEMVGEFPELQGRMGFYYANHDKEAANVAIALEEQYLPRHAGDRLPANPVGTALALADRLDTLAGVFTLGKKPTGNKDPFGLRRQALGLVRILIEGGIDLDLPAALQQAAELQPAQQGKNSPRPAQVAAEVGEFVVDRMRAWYTDGLAPGFARGEITAEVFASVLARAPVSPLDFHARLKAVRSFMQNDSAESLAAANKRIANILKKNSERSEQQVDINLFEASEEEQLHTAVTAMMKAHSADLDARNYGAALERLATLRAPVDAYFDKVMVMAEDKAKRDNRLAQLGQLRELFLGVADISHISAP